MTTRFSPLLPAILTLVAAPSASTQVRSPADLAQRLANSDPTHLTSLVSRYNLLDDSSENPCANFDPPSIKPLSTAKPGPLTAVEVTSRSCLTKFLIVFRQSQSAWTYAGTITLNQRYNQPTYEVLPLLPGPSPAIVIHGNVVDSGTGISQKNMQIFTLLGRTLRLVFNQPESIDLSVPFKPACCPVEYIEKQTSSFKIVQSTADDPSQIEETRRIQVNDSSVIQYRSWQWDARLQSFISIAFAPSP